jgi:hypothetical protein
MAKAQFLIRFPWGLLKALELELLAEMVAVHPL